MENLQWLQAVRANEAGIEENETSRIILYELEGTNEMGIHTVENRVVQT